MESKITDVGDRWLIPEDYGEDLYLVNLLFTLEHQAREALFITAYGINIDVVEFLKVCGYTVYRIGDERLAIQTCKGKLTVKHRFQIPSDTHYPRDEG